MNQHGEICCLVIGRGSAIQSTDDVQTMSHEFDVYTAYIGMFPIIVPPQEAGSKRDRAGRMQASSVTN
jgi:hypothetical protein